MPQRECPALPRPRSVHCRIRSHYRTLTPEAELYFTAETGRWPEAPAISIAARLALVFGIGAASALTLVFALYQPWRFGMIELTMQSKA